MKKVTIVAKVPANEKKGTKELTAAIDIPFVDLEGDPKKAMAEAVQMYGEKALLSNAFANWRVTLQGNIRSGLLRGEEPADLQARLGASKMGVATAGAKVDIEKAYLAKAMSATPEERAKMIERLKQVARG